MPACTYCDAPTDAPVTADDVDGVFCCSGCLEAHRVADEAEHEGCCHHGDGHNHNHEAHGAETETAFLHVRGMHCTSCEDFIETVAASTDGIHEAEASYASDMAKVAYDPSRHDESDLPALLSQAGYEAHLEAPADEAADQNTAARLIFGGFFGMMVMAVYIVLLYPVHLGGEGLVDLGADGGTYILTNVWAFTTFVLFVTGWPTLRGAAVSLRVLQPNMDLLVGLAAVSAYLYSTGAVLTGQTDVYFDVTVVIIMAVSLGHYYEDQVKRRATDLLSTLTREQVDEARRTTEGGGTETVAVDALMPGDRVQVRAGERIPVDGTVAEGRAAVDESLVTGESLPVTRTEGDDVIGGAVVTNNALTIEVGDAAESTLDRLVHLMWNIQSSHPGAQRVADRIAAVFVPLVLVLAAVAFGGQWISGTSATTALLTGLSVLIVSCPCALGLATPLAVASGLRTALEHGIVIRDVSLFETAPDIDTLAVDKTGTLTTGAMQVVDAVADATTWRRARAVEQHAAHPVARAIVENGEAVPAGDGAPIVATDVRSHPRGVEGRIDGDRVRVGHPEWLAAEGLDMGTQLVERAEAAQQNAQVPVAVGWDGAVEGLIVVGDTLRDEGLDVLAALRGSEREVVVLTGDSAAAARPLRTHDAIDRVIAEVQPAEKSDLVRGLRDDGAVAMIGDGSNDAPALAEADVGVAFGPTALAADSADVVILRGDLTHVSTVFSLAQAARRRIRQNLAWAFLYNAVAIPLALAGLINPLFAALAMAASSLGVVGNSARPLPVPAHSADRDTP
ncbi:heavy metal translocating P-type ATPase [Salinibacter altiplanensis]|uniref:heavy metal translocating P-type ATPase n=1 Tax=Salinibacter altiplanensis TaxID=1803181 RepID=UPI000C9FA46D|nr:cation-translocating P-type ATPase [Salinibacter altiplanensis]